MVVGMNKTHQSHDIAEGAYQLWRAAADFEQSASGPGTDAALPEALDYLTETLELLATGVEKASEAIEDLAAGPDGRALSPRARALRWHLAHLAARLLGARDVGPEARRWARDFLDEIGVDDGVLATAAGPDR